jgi:hypothetical protein
MRMATPKKLIKRAGDHATAKVTITPEGLKVLTEMVAAGNDQRTIAKKLGLGSHRTLQCIAERDAEVEEALDIGKALLADELTHLLLANARKGNVIAQIYLTKARLGWREGDKPDERPNIVINLPDSQTPEAYLRLVSEQQRAVLPPVVPKGIALQPPPAEPAPRVQRPAVRYADSD